MEFRILGPLEIALGERLLPLRGGRQRALVALLGLHRNEVVAKDVLVEELWPNEPSESAVNTLQATVSRLRKALGEEGGRLLTQAPGYLLCLESEELDAARFEALLREGRAALAAGLPEQAAETLRQALSLWRGPALADVGYERFAQAEIARLEELRLVCLEERIEAELQAGRHSTLVGEIGALVGEHPLRERFRFQLMLALYRCGRQAEALEQYQDARRALTEELGIDPGRQLRELHQAILNQDPALDLPVEERPERDEPAPAPAPPPTAEPVAREVRKTVTAVFVGMAISSARSEGLDPEALRRVTTRAFGEVQTAIERHGGTVETVAGDAITAVFGLPSVHEDDPLRSVRAASDVRAALADLAAELEAERKLELDFRIGVSTGEVVAGGSSGTGPELRATGQPLILSPRLGQAAGRGEIVIDAATRRSLRDAVVVEAVNGAWRLVDVEDTASAVARRLVSPMVGRERERRRLNDAFEQAVGDRSCQLFTVLGLAGVGKSRLVREFLGDLSGRARSARGRCLPYGEGITFWPLLEAIKEAVGLEDADSPEEVRAKLIRALGEEQGAKLAAQWVAEMIGLAEAAGGAEEGFAAVQALFEELSRTQPLVLVLDDIHWGEATFLDLVEHLADWARDAPILLLCLARPELLDLRPGWGGGKINATSVLLEPLSDEECSQLIENLVGEAEFPEEVERRIADAAEGNPLFVEEMLSMLIDDGLLARRNGHWIATGDIVAVPFPPTIQALLAARLDRLDPDERTVIEHASVQGKVFFEAAVSALVPETLRPSVPGVLAALVRKELIRPDRPSLGGRTYRFRHLLIRDAAYESIPKEARAEMNERFARWLEAAAGERATEYEEIVGYYLEQAYRYREELGAVDDAARVIAREAAERLGNAGRRAFVRSDAPAAVSLVSRAVALLPAADPLRVDLIPSVRVVQGMGGDMSWADRVLTEAVEAADATGDRALAAHALVQRGFLRLFFTEQDFVPAELIEPAERAIASFTELGDQLGLARAWRLIAQAHYLGRRSELCAEASERALAHARRSGDRFEEREIVEWLTIALWLGAAPAADAAQRCERLREETRDDPVIELHAVGTLAVLTAMQQQIEPARQLIARGHQIMQELGEWSWLFAAHAAFISLWLDEPTAAEAEIRPAYEALKKLGEKSHFTTMAYTLAAAVYRLGRYDEAEQLTRESEEAERPNDVHAQIVSRSTRAKVFARRGEFEKAERLAREALSFASESDFHLAHADALMDLAEVLELAGKRAAAAATVDEAIRLYELKGNVLMADRARALLGAEQAVR